MRRLFGAGKSDGRKGRRRLALSRHAARFLEPHQQVRDAEGDAEFDWQSTGTSPQFLLRRNLPLPGWQMLEVAIDHDQPRAAVKLCLDTGKGFDDSDCIILPLKAGRLTKRVFYAAGRVRAARFQPMEGEGRFSVRDLRFVWLSPRFAQDRLANRLSGTHYRWRELHKREVLKAVREAAKRDGEFWRDRALRDYQETFSLKSAGRSYRSWLAQQQDERPTPLRRRLKALSFKPTISILLPVYNTRLDWLRECLDSVAAQSYPNWQLCIADDASTESEVRALLSELAAGDDRVHLVFRETNGHICAASNSALELATGDYVALLDHDDCLTSDALIVMVEALNRQPSARLLYSDEDKLDDKGERFEPHFKPRWNPDLLLSQNYLGHFCMLQTALVRDLGGFRAGYEGSQDHDLLLRCSQALVADEIQHVAGVLYHWRAVEGSTAMDSREKSYTTDAGLAAIRDHLARIGSDAQVVAGSMSNTYRVTWPLPEPAPRVSLIIPTRDRVEILQPCVDAILQHTDYPDYEILIVDNESVCKETLDYMRRVAQLPNVRVLEWHRPFNYSAINNFAAAQASGTIIGLVNNDIEPIDGGWLNEMVRHACRPDIGCVGAKLYYPDNTVQHAGVILGLGGIAGHSHKYFDRNDAGYFQRLFLVQNLSAVTAACMLMRRAVFEEVGGLDEENLPIAFNDVDLCLRVQELGYRNLWTPFAELYHHESVSRGGEDTRKKRNRAQAEMDYMRERWGRVLDNDPAYNPYLTLAHEDFSLR